MKLTTKLAATFFISACALSTSVSAQESSLEQLVSKLVASAVDTVSAEIDQQVEKLTLVASRNLTIGSSASSIGKVTITDLPDKKMNGQADEKSQKNISEEAEDSKG